MTKEEFINMPMNDELARLMKDMLDVVHQCPDTQYSMYGVMAPPISSEAIQQMEEKIGIHLPEDFKWFLANVGVIHNMRFYAHNLSDDSWVIRTEYEDENKLNVREIYLHPLEHLYRESTNETCRDVNRDAFDSWLKELAEGEFINWYKSELFNDWTEASIIATLPRKIKISKPEHIHVGGRKIYKIVPLEQTLVKMYKDWYRKEYEEEPDIEDGHFTDNLDNAEEFIQDEILGNMWPDRDLGNVDFDMENLFFFPEDASTEEEKAFIGFHTLPNGVEFLGLTACGDWEYFMWFILYHDGHKLRGYIPSNGNTYNTDYDTAFGSECDTGKEYIPDYAKELEFMDIRTIIAAWAKRKGYLPMDAPDYEFELIPDFNLMIKDIVNVMEFV